MATGLLGYAPPVFWEMTPAELAAAMRGWGWRHGQGLPADSLGHEHYAALKQALGQ